MSRSQISVFASAVVSAAFLVGGCASAPPTQRIEASTSAIRAAQELGAERVPTAALHLQLAKEQSEHAKKLIEDGKHEEATLLLMRAEADADLAVALARADVEGKKASEAQNRVQELKGQNSIK